MTLFVALSAEQMASVEAAVADPIPLELVAMVRRYADLLGVRYSAVSIAFAGSVLALDHLRDRTDASTLALQQLGVSVEYARIPLDDKPLPNPRAPIPAGIRRRNRDRWQ